ncbi:MAG: putative bifunctional diguanylate cyclase/phosphodiesterase [Mycobacteriales bacterium]
MALRRRTATADPVLLRVWLPSTLLATTLVVVALVALPDGPQRSNVAGTGQLVAAVAAAFAAYRSRGRTRGCSRTWGLAGLGCLLWAIGQGWLIGAGAMVDAVSRPDTADVFFVLAVTSALVAALSFPLILAPGRGRGRGLLDGAVVGGCSAFVAWQLGLTSVHHLSAGAEFLGLTYTAATFGVTTILVGAASRDSRGHAKPLLRASAGLVLLAAMNVCYLHAIAIGVAVPDALGIGNVAGMALIGLGALGYRSDVATPGAVPKLTTRLQELLPLVGVATALVVELTRLPQVGRMSFAATAALALLLIGRQYLVLAENQDLATALVDGANRQISAQQALVASQMQYRRIVETANEGIWVTDRHGTTTLVNARVAAMLGMAESDMLGRSAMEVLSAVIDPAALAYLLEGAEERRRGIGASYDLSATSVDGRNLYVHVEATPLFDADGEFDGALTMVTDVSARVELEQELMRAARTDGLTGLGNRAALHVALESALDRQGTGALVYCDLDGFKSVNDSLGHSAGDTLLCEVAERLRECVRPDDIITRPGGDEFAVVLTGEVSAEDGVRIAERIIDGLAAPFRIAGHELFVGVSVGVALPGDEPQVERLLRDADLAMYHAKNDGRNRYSVYDPAMHAAVVSRLELEHDLRTAVDRDELVVLYQPILDLATTRCVGVEALLRWQHPTRGLLSPDVFIPIAEETGSIVDIGRWVLSRACLDAASWPDKDLYVSINVAPRQLVDSDLPGELRQVLQESGLAASRVVLEITERSLLAGDQTRRAIRTVRDTGARLALDDFGTGWSSIAHLHEHPIDMLKLDRSYVGGVLGDPQTGRLVAAILQMSSSLGIACTAEGVEEPAQATFLAEHGCGYAQGYLWAKPLPMGELLAWLGRPAVPARKSALV